MFLIRAKIHGLKGIYRKSGIKDIDIDFTLCKHKIILISGPNGSGKSTLLSVLNPLPDNAQMFIDKEECWEELTYIHNGIKYECKIIYPINKYGERMTTKAYLIKTNNAVVSDLNPNGNVGTYKNVIFREFGLDPNFIALSRLSSENRGIVERTPAERKKYVGAILEATTDYDNMNKVFIKRAASFKTMLNSIVSKIDSIGDYEYLINSSKDIQNRIKKLQEQKDMFIKQLAEAEAAIKVLDPDASIRDKYQELEKSKLEHIKHTEWLELQIMTTIKKDENLKAIIENDEIESVLDTFKETLREVDNDIHVNNTKIGMLMSSKQEAIQNLEVKRGKLSVLMSENNYADLSEVINKKKQLIAEYDNIISKFDIQVELTKEDYISALSVLQNANETITAIKQEVSSDNFIKAISKLSDDISMLDISEEIENDEYQISYIEKQIDDLNMNIAKNQALLETAKILEQRPEKCSDDTCPFILAAIKAKSQNPEDKLEMHYSELELAKNNLKSITEDKNSLKEIEKAMSVITSIIRSLQNYKTTFNKFPNGEMYTDYTKILNTISHFDCFNLYINSLNKVLDYINAISLKKIEVAELDKLLLSQNIYTSNKGILDELNSSIKEYEYKIENFSKEIQTLTNENDNKSRIAAHTRENIDLYQTVLENKIELDKFNNELFDINANLMMIETSISNIENAIKNVNYINSQLISIDKDLSPLDEEYKKILFSIERYKEYEKELQEYQEKYNTVEILKEYTSPSTGIQNLFIKLYMGTTLNLANKLLSLMFSGEMELLDYVINEKEFKIPCKSSQTSLINDDISSCSTGEKSMISLILGTVLFVQASSIYKILEWDEMDTGLDKFNKTNFIPLTQEIMDMFDIPQCIMISHATESVFNDVDVISLGPVNNEIPNGNVIFKL